MCDFAADAKAAEELMVGRTLTVARVRELNAKDYFYQMLKDNPEMLKIYPGIENELLQGAIDCHIHAFPDFVHRSQDMIQIAIEASKSTAVSACVSACGPNTSALACSIPTLK